MTKEILLTQGKIALVSDHRYKELSKYNWYAYRNKQSFYAARNERAGDKQVRIRMHSQITGFDMTDHIDGDGLNNQDENLRECTQAQNTRNRRIGLDNVSGFKGVSFRKDRGKWAANIGYGKTIALGLYDDPRDAAIAYDAKAIELHGEFARTNKSLGLLDD